MGLGAALYFSLPFEPPLWAGLLATVAAFSLAVIGYRRESVAFGAAMLALCLVAGFAVSTVRTRAVGGPVAPRFERLVTVEGWVVDVAGAGASGPRLEIAPTRIEGLAPDELPVRVRLSSRNGEVRAPGTAIRARALLNPPPGPASPGAYDFARDSWYHGIGGVGLALTGYDDAEPPPAPWALRARMALNAIRWSLTERIHASVGGGTGGVLAAMTTGHDAFVSDEDTAAMRDSGLAHVLSISGLHMAVVGGFVFFAARLLIAAWPWLALRINGKKAAAVTGLLAVGGYLALSGAPAPATRAAVTAAIAFLAILLDRRALSLRALAVAALVVLGLQPEAVVNPGFQMSFAATAALVALAEAWPARIREISAPWPILAVQRSATWIGGAVATSFVAGLATTPFAVQHFNRIAVYGLPANLVTAPLTSFVIMPALAVGASLAPLGLGGPFLWVAGQGTDAMLTVARLAAEQPGAVLIHASGPNWTLAVAFVGVLWLCLWRGPLRWLGLIAACAVVWWPRPTPPDLWVSADAANLAVRTGEQAVLARSGSREFAAGVWSRRRGLMLVGESDFLCSRDRCLPALDGAPVALWNGRRAPSAEDLHELCAFAEVVVVRTPAEVTPQECRGRLVIDGSLTARRGAAELWRANDGWRVRWSEDDRTGRPWGGASSGTGG